LKAMSEYREYVTENQDIKTPLRESYRHIALGSETFIERVKEKMEHKGQRREIPSTRILSEYDADTVITKMMQALHIEININLYKKVSLKKTFFSFTYLRIIYKWKVLYDKSIGQLK